MAGSKLLCKFGLNLKSGDIQFQTEWSSALALAKVTIYGHRRAAPGQIYLNEANTERNLIRNLSITENNNNHNDDGDKDATKKYKKKKKTEQGQKRMTLNLCTHDLFYFLFIAQTINID